MALQQDRSKSNEALFLLLSTNTSTSSTWLDLITNLSEKEPDLRKRILQLCSEQIIPSLDQPFLLLDFLVDSCKLGGIFSILSLKNLFLLIQKHNLDFPSFYEQLYSLLDQNLFHTKYKELLFELLEETLSSSHLPGYLVCAFVKRLSRLALGSSTTVIMWVVPFVYNILKLHPLCCSMLHQKDTDLTAIESDPYDWNASLKECNASQSFLWELISLRDHFYFKLAMKTKILCQKMTKPMFGLEEYQQLSIEQLMQIEQAKSSKHPAAIRTIEKESNLF